MLHSPNHEHRRADFQGVRALAVLAVMAHHFGFNALPGGFIGVDIFFVLSGFFICRMVAVKLEFSGLSYVLTFWALRLKRLLPNALLVSFAVLCTAFFIFPSYRLAGVAKDGLSAALFWSNFHFSAQAIDYFRIGEPASPFLHFWSLSVEEQFYFLFPLLLVIILSFSRGLKAEIAAVWTLLVLCIGSFSISLFLIKYDQPAAFFQLQSRAWQLAIGGILGLVFGCRTLLPAFARSMGAWVGVAIISCGLATLDDQMPYPGVAALVPTVGSFLLILGLDCSPLLQRVFSHRAAVYIGDRSYSLYLWHWPVIVWTAQLMEPSAVSTSVAILASLILAFSAYALVERPIHKLSLNKLALKGCYFLSGTALAATTCLSLVVAVLPRYESSAASVEVLAAQQDIGENNRNGCHLSYESKVQPPCIVGAVGEAARKVFLFGDSHAAQWYEPLAKATAATGWELYARTKTTCPSSSVVVWYLPARSPYTNCDEWRAERFREIESVRPQLVVIANSSRYRGWLYDVSSGRPAKVGDDTELWRAGILHTVRRIKALGIAVVVIRDTPEMHRSFAACLSEGGLTCGRNRKEALFGITRDTDELEEVSVLDFTDRLCSFLVCNSRISGLVAYRDFHHLTATFAAKFQSDFEKMLMEHTSN